MLPRKYPDGIHVALDDHFLVANAGLLLPATLALRLGLGRSGGPTCGSGRCTGPSQHRRQTADPGGLGLAGGDCIDDANALRSGSTGRVPGRLQSQEVWPKRRAMISARRKAQVLARRAMDMQGGNQPSGRSGPC